MIKLNGNTVIFEKFPNEETKLDMKGYQLYDSENELIFKYENDSDLIKLLIITKHIKSIKKGRLNLKITYMPYSRMDRVENESVFTLKYISEFINSLNFDSVIILEPHSNVTPALINNSKSEYINQEFVEDLLKDLGMDKENDYIMFPDNGAASRYKYLSFKNVLIGHKERDFDTGEIKGLNIIGNRNNNSTKVLIIDDLSSYGGTFVHSSIKLKSLGFEEVYLYITHAENNVFKGELFQHIDKLITTNSLISDLNNWHNRIYDNKLTIKQYI